ncbi:hypothetical protein KI387_026462, partial [Taxus chinensis]
MALRRRGCALYTPVSNILSGPNLTGDSTVSVRSFNVQKLHDHTHISQLLHGNYFILQHQLCAPPPQQLHLSTQDVATILRFLHLDVVKRKLRALPDACISYKQLLELCMDCTQKSSEDEGRDVIKFLEQSGDILRIGETVYLHPRQVARAMEGVLPLPLLVDECGEEEELRKMEKEKMEIDRECERRVRKELWCGL